MLLSFPTFKLISNFLYSVLSFSLFLCDLREMEVGRQLRVIWVFALFHWELHCFLTTVWKQARMPHDSMTQPCWFPFLSCSCSHSTTHTGILPAYRQNSHDAKQQTARTACQPLITANKSTSISTPHTICIQNIPLHLSCSRCKLQSFHSKYKGSQWTALWQ